MEDLATQFKAEYPDLLSLAIVPVETGIVIGGDDEASNIYVLRDSESWVVQTLQAHEHVHSVAEGLAVAARLARGEVHTCQEFRGEKLAASWFEYPVDGGLETGGVAAHLNPFDRDEWHLWKNETWRRVRTTRKVEGVKLSTSTFELPVDQPIHFDNALLGSLAEGLGEPAPGMKWRVDARGKLVLQIPSGWRSARTHEGSEDYEPEEGRLLIRTSVFYRNAESGHRELLGSATRPLSIDYAVLDGQNEWTQERWTLMFGEGSHDVMAWVELFADRTEPELAATIRDKIKSTIAAALYVPLDWDFETIS